MSLTPEQIVEVLRLTKSPNNGALMWAVDKDGLWVGVNCSDTFGWGCSDAEEITADNLPELRQAYADCTGIQYGDIWAPDLFAARDARPTGARRVAPAHPRTVAGALPSGGRGDRARSTDAAFAVAIWYVADLG